MNTKSEAKTTKKVIEGVNISRTCPVCRRARMKPVGTIRPGGRGRLRRVYMCPRCGYRSM